MGTESIKSRESLDVHPPRILKTIRRRWLPAMGVFVLTVACAALVATFQKETYVANAKLLFRVDRTSSLTGLGEGVGELDPLVRTQSPLVTEVEVISSRPLLSQVAEDIGPVNDGDMLSTGDIRRGLDVTIPGGSDVIRLSYEGKDPELAATIVNTLAKVYIENNVVANRAKTTQAREVIESQLPEAEAFVRESESNLRQFKEANQIVAIDQQSESVVRLLENLDNQILEIQASLEEATTRSTQLRNSLALSLDDAMRVTDLSQSPSVQGVLQDLQQAERNLATQQGFYTDNSPNVQTTQLQIRSLESLLEQEVSTVLGDAAQVPEQFLQTGETRQAMISNFLESEVQRLSLASKLDTLYDAQQIYRSRSNDLPRLEQQEAELQRTLEVARLSYQTLLQRLQELRVIEDQASGNAQLIEPATVPGNPNTTTATLILVSGVLIGALLAATVVFLLELNDYYVQPQGREQSPRSSLEPAEH